MASDLTAPQVTVEAVAAGAATRPDLDEFFRTRFGI